ncbi:MAG: hypothetical protein MJ107_04565 [Lachnospiraceae bacterium]|nr:hypothetical protein [Lachnospiraceae bacterium]
MRNKVLATIFIAFICITAVGQKSYLQFSDLVQTVITAQSEPFGAGALGNQKKNDTVSEELSIVEDNALGSLPYRTGMVRLNGAFLKAMGTRSYYDNQYGMSITRDGYIVGQYNRTTTDYEVAQMISFKEFLDEKGIRLLYVSESTKYIDDSFYSKEFGAESYINRNADLFLERIGEAGIDYLDLRDKIAEEGLDSQQMFYRTDHHWTVPAAFWAASKVAEKLNESGGYNIDTQIYNEDNYYCQFYENSWLGEQGWLVADTYVGLDDYTTVEPTFDTSFSVYSEDGVPVADGSFDIFIDKSVYYSDLDYYDCPSWHYSYDAYNGHTVHNNYADYGNVLILGDSYETPMAPFLALGIQDMKLIVMRNFWRSVREEVELGNYDTVIMAYAQFMIGAHDDESNAHYNMFNLE